MHNTLSQACLGPVRQRLKEPPARVAIGEEPQPGQRKHSAVLRGPEVVSGQALERIAPTCREGMGAVDELAPDLATLPSRRPRTLTVNGHLTLFRSRFEAFTCSGLSVARPPDVQDPFPNGWDRLVKHELRSRTSSSSPDKLTWASTCTAHKGKKVKNVHYSDCSCGVVSAWRRRLGIFALAQLGNLAEKLSPAVRGEEHCDSQESGKGEWMPSMTEDRAERIQESPGEQPG